MRIHLTALSLALLGCGGAEQASPAPSPSRAPKPPVQLAVGEVAAAGAAGDVLGGSLRVAGGERFVLVLTSASLGRGDIKYEVVKDLPDELGGVVPVTDCALAAEPRVPPQGDAPPDQPSKVQRGDLRHFTVRLEDGLREVVAMAVAIGRSTVVWADATRHHRAVLDEAFVAEFLESFEGTILRRARTIFGGESDIDGDGRISLLFTPLTAASAVAFFSACDLRPTCKGSNGGELLYLTPPNAIRPPYNTPRAIKEILAHELEHLIHHRHKVLDNSLGQDPDSAYMLEGFGALAQDVTGLQAGNLYVTKAGLDGIDTLSLADLLVESTHYDAENDGPLRGGAYLFVRWLYDRAGADEALADGGIDDRGGPSLVRRLLKDRRSIADALIAGTSLDELAPAFFTSLASAPASTKNPCASFLRTVNDPVTGRQRGADPFAHFHGMAMEGPASRPLARADGSLRMGGVEYLTLEAAKAGVLSFGVRVRAASASANLHVIRLE